MLLSGHIGFTLGAATLIQQLRKRPALRYSQLALLAAVALLPDILDRSIHFAYARYPEHLLFHSLPLYVLAIACMWKLHRKTAFILMVMALNVCLDFVNNAPGALLFPLAQLGCPLPEEPLAAPLIAWLPHWLTVTWSGHCIAFEVIGAILGVWALLQTRKRKPEVGER